MRRATWILWLMLALLPLRSWAVASMGLPPAGAPVAGAQSAAAPSAAGEPADAVATPACHMAGTDDPGIGMNCQACDWCHAVFAPAASAPQAAPAALADPPARTPVRDTGRQAVGGLDRPPRSLLA